MKILRNKKISLATGRFISLNFKALLLLCLMVTSGCQYNIPGIHKKTPATSEYIPPAEPKQTLKQDEVPNMSGVPAIPVKIALLVPLSGNYKDLGQGLLDAAQLAVFRIGDTSLVLVPLDTKGTPFGATQAAKQAVAQGAKIILGPVFSGEAKAISKVATENNLPVVSFSNDKTLADTGIFTIGLMPEQQVQRMVNFALAKGIKDFATLLPADAYGTTVTNELQRLIAGHTDVAIRKNETYQTDSRGLALSLENHVKNAFATVANGGEATPAAMLMPGSAALTGQIFGILDKNNLASSKVLLLGNDQWLDKTLLANPAMEGAWFTALPRARRNEFENKFKNTYGYDAPKLSGLAYDGIALAATIIKIAHGGDFDRSALTSQRGFIGVDGIFRLQENGLTERGFAIMSVKGGQPVVIDAAPTAF